MTPIPFGVQRITRGVRFRLTRRLRDRDPADAWPGIEAVAVLLRPFAARFGNVQPHELAVLASVARLLRPRRLFEFGTFDGLTAWHLVRNAGPRARLWTLDLPADHPAGAAAGAGRSAGRGRAPAVGHQFAGTPEAARIVQLCQDSLAFDPRHRPPGRMDFCFIDAGHDYDHVRADTHSALAMVRPGGVIFWHDYSRWWPGVQRCLDELSRSLPVFRVAGTSLAALRVPEAVEREPECAGGPGWCESSF